MDNKKVFKITLYIIASILTIVMLSSIGLNIFYKTKGKDSLPQAITSTYVTQITNPNSGEKLSAIEASYFANKNNKGYEVVELLFNTYSGIDKQAIYSRGFQLVYNNPDGSPNLYYYDKYDGVSFETGHEYTFGDKMIVDIDGETYAIALDGTYTTTGYELNPVKTTTAFLTFGLSTFIWNPIESYSYEEQYTFEDLLVKIGSIIRSSSNGIGDSIIPLVDLGDFLHIYEINDKGVISSEPVSQGTLANSYFTMDTDYDNRGMTWSKQSMFKSVAYDSQYNISGLTDATDFWKATSQIELSESDFIPRSSSSGYYSLNVDKVSEINKYKEVDVVINFNIDNIQNIDVLGLDYFALYGIDVKELNIYSSENCSFELLKDSISNSDISITTKNVTLINNSGVSYV